MVSESLFADVQVTRAGLSIPELKWRELLFTGAMRPDGEAFVRDPARPMAPFAMGDPFPPGVRFRARAVGGRVELTRMP